MKVLTLLSLILLFSFHCSFASTQAEVSVIFSSDREPYQKTWQGFKEVFDEKNISLHSSKYYFEEDNADTIIRQIAQKTPDIVFSIGPQSSMFAKDKIKDIPLVFSLVLRHEEMIGQNITGVSLAIPASVRLTYIKKILPHVKRIGMIYSSQSTSIYEELLQKCIEMGFQLLGKEINSAQEFTKAVDDISWQIDSFLMIPDTNIYFQQSIKYLLLECLREKIPVIGLSSAYTKAGAFISFECDYRNAGRQAGEIALKILKGEKPENITPAIPRKVTFSLNLLVAERLGITVPPDVINEANEVFD